VKAFVMRPVASVIAGSNVAYRPFCRRPERRSMEKYMYQSRHLDTSEGGSLFWQIETIP
jgi:hypothetical protein